MATSTNGTVKASKNRVSGAVANVAAAKEPKEVRLIRPRIRGVTLVVKGLGVLVMQKFSEKAIRTIAGKQQKSAQGPREAKNPVECFRGAMHLMPGGDASDDHPDVGFPASGFRKAMIRCAPMVCVKRPVVQGAVFVLGDDDTNLVRINYDKVQMREDAVRNTTGVVDLRYRPEFHNWSAEVRIRYDEGLISVEQVVNLMNRAGFSVGIGEDRPEKGGSWGQFEAPTYESA